MISTERGDLVKSSLFLGALLAAAIQAAPAAQAAASTPAEQHSCHMPGFEDTLRCVKLPVALDYARPAAGTLSLHVTVAPALREGARADPLFVLAGGPGEAGSDVLPLLSNAFRRVRPTRDIVFIDQRGTGLSGKLECEAGSDDDATLSEEQVDAAVRKCIAGRP